MFKRSLQSLKHNEMPLTANWILPEDSYLCVGNLQNDKSIGFISHC